MAIKYVGAKRLQGLKSDRVSDSLGSSADGTNTGVTLLGTTGTDSGTANADGTGSGITYGQTGKVGNAISFDGSNDYIYFPDTPDTNFTFGAGCTVSWNMWYKASSTGQSARLWSQARGSGGGSNERGVTFGIVSGTGFNLFASTSNSDYYLNGTDANVIPNDTNWHMLTVTFDEDGGSNNLKIYIDGSSVATRSGTTSGSASNPAYYPNIGRMVSATEYFAGLIDEYSVWSRVLTTSEITALYNSGNGAATTTAVTNHTGIEMYYPMNESSGTVTNFAGLGKAKLGTGCYKYDGDLDYTRMDAGATTFTDKGTIALWINATNNADSRTAVSSKADNSTNPQIMIRGDDDGDLNMTIAGQNTTIGQITEGTWYHVAITWDQTANICKSYLNGKYTQQRTGNGSDFTGNDTCRWILGMGYNTTTSGRTWDGKLDDFGLWSRILTDDEIEALANNVERTPELTSNLSSDSGWEADGSAISVNTSGSYIDSDNNNGGTTHQALFYDLGSALSTGWVIDLDLYVTACTNSGSNWTHIGMHDTDQDTDDDDNQNFLGINALAEYTQISTGNGNYLGIMHNQNTTLGNASPTGVSGDGDEVATGNQFYLRLIRDGNTLKLERHATSSRTGSTLTTTRSITMTAGLRYFGISHRSRAHGGRMDLKIENVKIWDGYPEYDTNGALVTSISKEGLKAYYSMNSLDLDSTSSINWNGADDCDVTATSIKKKSSAGDDWDVKAYTTEQCKSGGTITTTFKANEISSSNTGWWVGFGTDAASTGYVNNVSWYLKSNGKAGIAESDGNEESEHTITTSSVLKMVYTFGTGASTGECKWYIDGSLEHTESSITNPTHKTLNFSSYVAGKGVNTLTLTIDNVGCQNNYSSTSPLDDLTGVRTNAIFEQTDDVPAYYWYQTLDSKTDWFPQIQDNFSDTTRWIATGDKTVNVTGNAIEASSFQGNDSSERVYGEVGDLETKFVADFDYYQGTAGSGAYWSLCSFQSGTDYPFQSGMDSVGLIVDMGNYAIYTRSYDGSSENSTQTGDSISLSHSTQYYVRITRDGDDFTFSFYTDSARTSATKVGTRTLTDTGITGLKYFQSGYFTGGNSGAINYKITNLKIYNGVTSV